jgi:hypothetical protein
LKSIDLKNLAVVAAVGFISLLGTGSIANAQSTQDRKMQKRQEKIEQQRDKLDHKRIQLQKQRHTEWARRSAQIGSSRVISSGYYTVDPHTSITEGRYRVYRSGNSGYYSTDNRGADLLRQAVNEGYRQGFSAGRSDRNGNRMGGWSRSNIYRSGTVGYQKNVDRGQYQYYFRQGFQRGYQDGSNSEYTDGYNGSYQYGSYENGSLNIHGTILNQVLNIQNY